VELAATDKSASAASAWLICADGSKLPGRCTATTDGKIRWEHPSLGRMDVPLEDARVYLPPRAGRSPEQADDELASLLARLGQTDTVYMTNGDSTGGVVESIGPESVVFNCKVGKLTLAAGTLSGRTFSQTLKPWTAPAETCARLTLTDGTVLVGALKGAGDKLSVTAAAAKFDVTRKTVSSIEMLNTKRVFLSDLEPAYIKETPYFDRVWNWQRDRSVWGRELTIAGIKYPKGIGMHARCQLDYDLAGKYRVFLTDLGIDAETAGAGDCVAVVYGDGKPLTEALRLTGKSGARKIKLDVSTIKRLSLLVDFGENTDAGDHVTWGNARLVRK